MLYYVLDHQIDGNKILSDIQDLINKEIKNNNEKYILVVQIKKVNYTTNELVPKITYEPPWISTTTITTSITIHSGIKILHP